MRTLPLVSDHYYYVALGDTQGMDLYAGGPGRGAASLLHRRLQDQTGAFRLIPLMVEGAMISTVRYAEIPRLAEMQIHPEIVTLLLGTAELNQMALYPESIPRLCREIEAQGKALLTMLRSMMTSRSSRIILTTIYDFGDGSDTNLTQSVVAYNDTIRALASTQELLLADIASAFAGHGSAVGDPFQPEATPTNMNLYLRAGSDPIPVPNTYGAQVIADVLYRTLYPTSTELPEKSKSARLFS